MNGKNLKNKCRKCKKKHEELKKKEEEIKDKVDEAKSLKDLEDLKKDLEDSEIYEDAKEKLEKMIEAKEEQAKDELIEKIEEMKDDGFISEERAEEMLNKLESGEADLEDFKEAEAQLSYESRLYNEYAEIKQEIMPLVEEWYRFFAERLPKISDIDYDEDTLTRRGKLDRRSISKPRNLVFGLTQNPPIIKRSVQPRFMASIVMDISGSMSHRIKDARKLLVFFAELFEKISEEFGYIKYSISAFDDVVELIKDFDQKYDSPDRYDFGGQEKTIKVRLMETTMARGGTDMGRAIWDSNRKLNDEKNKHPDYLSAMYTVSDGETGGELAGDQLKRFMEGEQEFWGEWWGDHMKCGFMLGPESQKSILEKYFGDDDSIAVPKIEELIEKVMLRFDEDVMNFINRLPEE